MTHIDCTELVDLAPEFAAGNLCGEERAAVISHLATCPSCQQLVNSLTAVTDRLLLLAPHAEPPPGFEQRVLAAFSHERPDEGRHERRRRRLAALIAGAALVITFAVVGLLLGLGSSGEPAFADAEMRTASGEVVGQVFVHHDEPVSLVMTLPGWAEQIERYGVADVGYTVHIETDDGQVTIRPATFDEDASWATTLDIDADTVASVAVVDGDGHIWCHADFD